MFLMFHLSIYMFSVFILLLFNLFSHRLIRLSSPNLNYIIGIGAIILYMNVIVFVIPTNDRQAVAVLCNVR